MNTAGILICPICRRPKVRDGWVTHRDCDSWKGVDMNMDDERQRSISAKIERLRQRVKSLREHVKHRDSDVVGILLGILDLLGDEL